MSATGQKQTVLKAPFYDCFVPESGLIPNQRSFPAAAKVAHEELTAL